MKPRRVPYPKKAKHDILQFTRLHKQLKAPFVVYADFESSLNPEGEVDVTNGLTKEKKKGGVYQTLKAAYDWYKIVSIDPNFDAAEKKIYVGKDAGEYMLH